VNHTRFPKDDHLPDWARQDNKVTKGDRVEKMKQEMFNGALGFTHVGNGSL